MTPDEFEKWKNDNIESESVPLSKEDFEFAMDMMAMQDLSEFNPKKDKPMLVMDGMAVVQDDKECKVYYTDIETIKYEKALRAQKRKQSRKQKFYIVK